MARGSRKKPLDVGDNPDLVTLGLGLQFGLRYPATLDVLPRVCLTVTSYSRSAALV